MRDSDVVIVSGGRTPMGGFQGCLSSVTAVELGSLAIKSALERAGLQGADIDEVIMGCVLPAGVKQGPARQAMLRAGIPDSVGAITVNKLCGSGMKAVMLAHDSIKAGTNSLVVAGGMESMSNAPYILEKARTGYRMGHSELKDHMFLDGLEDFATGRLMGSFAQDVADRYGLSREAMDDYAMRSLTRAQTAIRDGLLNEEMVPVKISGKKGDILVTQDEQPAAASVDKIPTLRPAFRKDGTITAANSSSISDGASAVLIASAAAARQKGLQPMARIIAHSTHSMAPADFTIAPIGAIDKLLKKTGWSREDVDLFEINEAFAMVTMLAIQENGLDATRVNVTGGACAQGHPVGSTGSRLLVTLMYALRRLGKKRGIAALCIGGGEATAVALEML